MGRNGCARRLVATGVLGACLVVVAAGPAAARTVQSKSSTSTTKPATKKLILPNKACPLLTDDEAQELMGGAELCQSGTETGTAQLPACAWGAREDNSAFSVNLQLKKNKTTSATDFAQFAGTKGVKKVPGWGSTPTAVQLVDTGAGQGSGTMLALLGGTLLVRLFATSPNGVYVSQLDTAMRVIVKRLR